MIEGHVDAEGVPYIPLMLGQRRWMAIVDTGFNGGLDLPRALSNEITGKLLGRFEAELANGVTVTDEVYRIRVVFDDEERFVPASFSDTAEVLIGTRLLRRHFLEIDFPTKTVRVSRRA
jgi:predicted aspartyl protease